jgi:hypothetical protein
MATKTALDLQPGDKIRLSAGRVRTYKTTSLFDDGETTLVRAYDQEPTDREVELVVRVNYDDNLVRCIVLGTGLGVGENVGQIHASVNETFTVVPGCQPEDYFILGVSLSSAIDLDLDDSEREIRFEVETKNERVFVVTLDVDDLESTLYDFDVAGVDTNGEPVAEPEFGAVVSLLAVVSREVEA